MSYDVKGFYYACLVQVFVPVGAPVQRYKGCCTTFLSFDEHDMSMQAHGSWRALCLTLTILALFCQPAVGKDKKPQDVAGYYDSVRLHRRPARKIVFVVLVPFVAVHGDSPIGRS
eukprot:3309940-Rhodomonas_salina.1